MLFHFFPNRITNIYVYEMQKSLLLLKENTNKTIEREKGKKTYYTSIYSRPCHGKTEEKNKWHLFLYWTQNWKSNKNRSIHFLWIQFEHVFMRQCALLEDSSCGKSHNSVKRTKSRWEACSNSFNVMCHYYYYYRRIQQNELFIWWKHCWVTIYIHARMCLYECVLKSYEIKLMIQIDSFFEKYFFILNVCSLLNQRVLILCDLIEEKFVVLSKHSKWFQATVTDILIRFCGVTKKFGSKKDKVPKRPTNLIWKS